MIGAVGILQDVVAVVAAEAGERFGFGEALQLGEREHFARAGVLPGFVEEIAVAERGRGVVVGAVDRGDGLGEFDLLGRFAQALQESIDGHLRALAWERPRSVASHPA